MFPILHTPDMLVLDRIEVNVIDVPREIALVAQCVLPVTSLPNTAFVLAGAACRNLLLRRKSTRECRLYQPPASREISIAIGQGPHGMQMIRQHHDGIDGEWMSCPRVSESRAQVADVFGEQS